jgi:chitin disaccharide deacetylase
VTSRANVTRKTDVMSRTSVPNVTSMTNLTGRSNVTSRTNATNMTSAASLAVIINADDLGISREVNDATFDLIAKGRISSATIMANAPATREAARRAAMFPRCSFGVFRKCSFGVHLNLTEFEPLTSGPDARLLVGERGQMSRARLGAAAKPRIEWLRAVYVELCAQVERVGSMGVGISHIDSHHHVHTMPFVFPAMKAVQRRYGIRRVRLAKNFYSPEQPCPAGLVWKKRAYNWALRSMYATRTTDAFTEFLTYYHAEPTRKRMPGRIELMVHPGASYAAEETALLDTDWIARSESSLQLISYAQLA